MITATREQFHALLNNTFPENIHPLSYNIPPFSHTELIDIIQKPMALASVGFEYNEHSRERLSSEISSEIIQQLQSQSVPISSVQYLLAQLYIKKFNQLITYKAYEEINGIAGSLASIAEQTYQQLTEQEQACFPLILFRLITLNANGQIATNEQPCPIDHFVNNKLSVINAFSNAGIFQLALVKKQTYVHIAHQSLLIAWPRISLWVKENISTLYVRHDLHVATQRWLYHEKSRHLFIHSNKKIKHLHSIIRGNDFDISPDEKTLIALSTRKITRNNRLKRSLFASFLLSFISLAWLSVTLVEKNNQIATTRDNAENLISFILYDLKDKLAPLGKIELLNIVADKTVDYFTLAGTDHLTGKSLIQWVEALHILGDVNISKNNYAEAEAYFQQTLSALTHALAKNVTSVGSAQNEEHEKLLALTMLANYWLGYSAYLQLDYQAALPFLTSYLTYADKLALHYPKEKWQLEQSYALNNLGALAEKNGALPRASEYFERSAQIKLALLKRDPENVAVRTYLVDTRSWQSNIQAKAGKLNLAIDNLKQALTQLEKIHSAQGSFNSTERLAELEHKVALLYYNTGDLTNASKYNKSAEKNILKLVNNDSSNYLLKEELLWSYLLKIRILINQNNIDITLIYSEKATNLISLINRGSTGNNEVNNTILRANISLLLYRARTMALLKQTQKCH